MANHYTRVLASFAANLRYEDIPREVIEHAKMVILDGLGCALYGSTLPWSRILAGFLIESQPPGRVTVWGTDKRVSCADAALTNGTFTHAFELDDLHGSGHLHGASVTIAPALSVAEDRGGVAGKDFLAAVIGGIEVATRVSYCMGSPHLLQGWHAPYTCGTFGAGAAAGIVTKLNEEQMVHCLGLCGTQAAGLMAVQYGAMAKRFHAGKACQGGVYSALLAQRGFTGPTNIFEAEFGGFCTTFSNSKDNFDLSKLTDGLGQHWETMGIEFKVYSARGPVHTSLDAIRKLRQQHRLPADEVEKITVWAPRTTVEPVGWKYVPNSVTAAQLNLAYGVAIMLLEGDAFIDQYTEDKIASPEVLRLTDRVEVIHDPSLDPQAGGRRFNIRMELKLKDGSILSTEVTNRRGSRDYPLSQEEIVEKFKKLASKVMSQKQMDRVIKLVDELESLTNVNALVRELAVA